MIDFMNQATMTPFGDHLFFKSSASDLDEAWFSQALATSMYFPPRPFGFGHRALLRLHRSREVCRSFLGAQTRQMGLV